MKKKNSQKFLKAKFEFTTHWELFYSIYIVFTTISIAITGIELQVLEVT